MVMWNASRPLRLTGTVHVSTRGVNTGRKRGCKHTAEDFANLLQLQQTTNLAGTRLGAHTSKPGTQQDGRDGILNRTIPLVVVPW